MDLPVRDTAGDEFPWGAEPQFIGGDLWKTLEALARKLYFRNAVPEAHCDHGSA